MCGKKTTSVIYDNHCSITFFKKKDLNNFLNLVVCPGPPVLISSDVAKVMVTSEYRSRHQCYTAPVVIAFLITTPFSEEIK
jgi:hypothetical protein